MSTPLSSEMRALQHSAGALVGIAESELDSARDDLRRATERKARAELRVRLAQKHHDGLRVSCDLPPIYSEQTAEHPECPECQARPGEPHFDTCNSPVTEPQALACWCGGDVRRDEDGLWCLEDIHHDPQQVAGH